MSLGYFVVFRKSIHGGPGPGLGYFYFGDSVVACLASHLQLVKSFLLFAAPRTVQVALADSARC